MSRNWAADKKNGEKMKDEMYKLKNLFNFSYYDDSRSDKGETSKLKNNLYII